MKSRELKLRLSIRSAAALCGAILLVGCGGSSTGSDGINNIPFTGGLGDPIVPLAGTPGVRYSRVPQQANDGADPPPSFPSAIVSGQNQYIRIEFPFTVDPPSILDPDVIFAPFSTLNGNITITDSMGNHVPGIATVNGVDASGRDLSLLPGWPEELNSGGGDRNLGLGRFVYIATAPGEDSEENPLDSRAAFGGASDDTDSDSSTTDLTQLRIAINEVNGATIDAFWVINFGAADSIAPDVTLLEPSVSVQGEPMIKNKPSADVNTEFVLRFTEPVVPQTVSLSARFNSDRFRGNLPSFTFPNPPQPPFPTITISTPNAGAPPRIPQSLFIPFDCNPVNRNNMSKYRIRPLIPLPSEKNIIVTVRSSGAIAVPTDLVGNQYANGDMVGDFESGPGPAVVNAPVCPEVLYWSPASGQGIGAIDLNGNGFTTNTPNSHEATELDKTAIITRVPFQSGPTGRARDGIFNFYVYPVGTGSANLAYSTPGSFIPEFTGGNPGTPIPGINEKSDGFETFVKDSTGSVNLTGGNDGVVGNVSEILVGTALDTVFFDVLNAYAASPPVGQRTSFFNGVALDHNSMADPPTPNPPPLRFAVGLQPISFVLDNSNPTDPVGLLIEGEEVFGIGGGVNLNGTFGPGPDGAAGTADDGPLSRLMLLPSKSDPLFGPDFQPSPFIVSGPAPQSTTSPNLASSWQSRQQIGNYLYVADRTNNVIRVLNSNTMRLITTVETPDPYGLSMTSDLKSLYVSNFADDTVSVVGIDPRGAGFHEEINRIGVGSGPRAISVQPDNEDVLVCNWVGNNVDIIDITRAQVRKTLEALIAKPFDVVLTDRHNGQTEISQATGYGELLYFGFISNFAGNNLVVYESGPDGPPNPLGLNNILGAIPDKLDAADVDIEVIAPRRMCFDPGVNPDGFLAGGVYVAHQDSRGNGIASRIQFSFQAQFGPIPRFPPPGFFIPPGFSERRFEVVAQWGQDAGRRLSGNEPTSVCTSDLSTSGIRDPAATQTNFAAFQAPGELFFSGIINTKHPKRLTQVGGAPIQAFFPDRVYVTFADSDSVDVLDPNLGGVVLKTINGGLQAEGLYNYWSQ